MESSLLFYFEARRFSCVLVYSESCRMIVKLKDYIRIKEIRNCKCFHHSRRPALWMFLIGEGEATVANLGVSNSKAAKTVEEDKR